MNLRYQWLRSGEMPKLSCVNSGNVFTDNFEKATLGKRWTVSPSLSARYSLEERPSYLRIKHAETPTYILTDLPLESNLMFQIKNDYQPEISTDIGGIIVFKTLDDRVELVEYFDELMGLSRNYLYVRMYKNKDVFDGYGSQDGIKWELIGSARIEDATKIGLVLNGEPHHLARSLDVDYVSMYTDRFLYVTNLSKDWVVEMYSAGHERMARVVAEDDTGIVNIDMFSIPLPFTGYIKLSTPTGLQLYQTDTLTLDPGDEYQYSFDISVRFQRKRISVVEGLYGDMFPREDVLEDIEFVLNGITHIGSVDDSVMTGKVIVTNLDDYDIRNLQVSIESFDYAYSNHIIDLAKDDNGEPGNYQRSIIINVPAGGETEFWLRSDATGVTTLSKKDLFKYKLCFRNV